MKSYYDVLTAVFFLLLSASAAFFSYGYLQKLSEETVLFAGIPLSNKSYLLTREDGRCIGNLDYFIEDDSSSRAIRLIGRVNVENAPQLSSQVAFGFEFRFNPIGQLTDTEARILSPSFDRYFSTVNTNPILITISDYTASESERYGENVAKERNIYFRSTLPGPLRISATDEQGFALQLEALRGIEQSYVNILRGALLSQLGVTFEESEMTCEEPDPLDIEAVKNGLLAAMDFLLVNSADGGNSE